VIVAGVERRWVAFNGALGTLQLEWLQRHLRDAAMTGQAVIVAGHIPIHPSSCQDIALLWNYNEVLTILHEWRPYLPSLICLHGHDHGGGIYYDDINFIHHQVIEGALLCAPGRAAYGRIDIYDNKIDIVGVDLMRSSTIPFTTPKPYPSTTATLPPQTTATPPPTTPAPGTKS
jgi:manganese-dependent ADP-ribose/CDP-alcohol diphosphatase